MLPPPSSGCVAADDWHVTADNISILHNQRRQVVAVVVAMKAEEEILEKIYILMTNSFSTQQASFVSEYTVPSSRERERESKDI